MPPTASKGIKKQSVSSAISKFIYFQDALQPLESVLTKKPTQQPFILAVGNSKAAVSQYFVVFDEHILVSPKPDILSALDLCVKVHFVFDLKFEFALHQFYMFILCKFYCIKQNISNRIIEIQTKLDHLIEAGAHAD